MEDTRPIEDKVLDFLSTLHDNHVIDDQQWIRTLLEHGVNNTSSEIVELGAMIQTTIMDMLIGKLLGINPTVLAKAALVEDYIGEIWEHNNLNKQSLYNFIMDNPQQREAILQIIQPNIELVAAENMSQPTNQSAIENTTQNHRPGETCHQENIQYTTLEQSIQVSEPKPENQPILVLQEETPIQEITMAEANTVEEPIVNVTAHDIKEIPDYRIRNRIAQPINPFFITEKGSYTAGVLMANIPGDDIEERINYLAHMFKLAKDERKLIGTTFVNGNHWFTIKFKLHLDMENCIERLNGKEGEDFKIICLKGGYSEEREKKSSTSATQISTQPTPPATKRKEERIQYRNKGKETMVQPITDKKEEDDISNGKKDSTSNLYNLSNKRTQIGIGMLVGTFPGNNRQEQLAILAEIFRIPKDSELIQIEYRNGNSWFTGYFEKEEERTYCIDKVEEVNKEITNLDTSATSRTFRIIKLEDTQTKGKHTSKSKETDKKEITIQILDIPEEFSVHRIKGAIKSYGTIVKLQIQPGKRHTSKIATVTFNNLKIDLEQTWAIPMGEIMARIAPIEAQENIFTQRNQFTARLYGIGRTCSATRIMSAIKHTSAKTVHIPTNSRTGKKRSFAIIGFEDNTNLEKAITKYISLFGCKTWWSTKDNTKVLGKQSPERKETRRGKKSQEKYESEPEVRENFFKARNFTYASQQNKDQRRDHQSHEKKQKREHKSDKRNSRQEISSSLTSLTTALQEITKRLSKLEGTSLKGRVAYRS